MGKVFYLKIYTPLNPLSRGEMFICLTPSVWVFIWAWPKKNQHSGIEHSTGTGDRRRAVKKSLMSEGTAGRR